MIDQMRDPSSRRGSRSREPIPWEFWVVLCAVLACVIFGLVCAVERAHRCPGGQHETWVDCHDAECRHSWGTTYACRTCRRTCEED